MLYRVTQVLIISDNKHQSYWELSIPKSLFHITYLIYKQPNVDEMTTEESKQLKTIRYFYTLITIKVEFSVNKW